MSENRQQRIHKRQEKLTERSYAIRKRKKYAHTRACSGTSSAFVYNLLLVKNIKLTCPLSY